MTDSKSAERFWNRVDIRGPDECWVWRGARHAFGYGKLKYLKQLCYAHRVAAALSGMDVTDMQVCHACDNPPCCNPSHLFLGTLRDNLADMRRKERHAKGSGHGRVRLSETAVRAIRSEYAHGGSGGPGLASPTSYGGLAVKYGVSPATIIRIVRRRGWQHI